MSTCKFTYRMSYRKVLGFIVSVVRDSFCLLNEVGKPPAQAQFLVLYLFICFIPAEQAVLGLFAWGKKQFRLIIVERGFQEIHNQSCIKHMNSC